MVKPRSLKELINDELRGSVGNGRLRSIQPVIVECYGCRRPVESFSSQFNGVRYVAAARCDVCAHENRGVIPDQPTEIKAIAGGRSNG